jgi:hypothetical protein
MVFRRRGQVRTIFPVKECKPNNPCQSQSSNRNAKQKQKLLRFSQLRVYRSVNPFWRSAYLFSELIRYWRICSSYFLFAIRAKYTVVRNRFSAAFTFHVCYTPSVLIIGFIL